MTLNINGKGITNPKTVSDYKKYAIFCVSKVLIWRQKWVVVLVRTKYAVPRQIKPGILTLTIRRGQSNFQFQFGRDSFETVYAIQFDGVWFCRLRQDLCQVAQ